MTTLKKLTRLQTEATSQKTHRPPTFALAPVRSHAQSYYGVDLRARTCARRSTNVRDYTKSKML